MATYQVTSPDGATYEITAPDDATEQQIIDYAKANMPKKAASTAQPVTKVQQFARGAMDPVTGLSQLLYHSVPQSWRDAGNRVNNLLADAGLPFDKIPESGLDTLLAEDEAQYQAGRQAAGSEGVDWTRLAGNVLSPANLAVASKIPVAASAAGRIGTGAATGALFSAAQPVQNTDEFWTEKAKQSGIGAVTGGLLSTVGEGLSRVISPKASTNPSLAMMKESGVHPTIGQTLGGRLNTVEEKLQSVPILGDAISNARSKSISEFNRAAIDRAVSPIGEKVDDIGFAGIRQATQKLSAGYKSAINGIKGIKFDQQFDNDLSQLETLAQGLVRPMREKFQNKLSEIVKARFSPNQSMIGQTYKRVDSEIGNLAARYRKSTVASEKELGDAFAQLQSIINQAARRSNPQFASKMDALDKGWANLVRVQQAGKAAKNNSGVFTPGQLNTAVQVADKSVRKSATAQGQALMQDLANAGQSVLGSRVPNSFTTDRLLMGGGALGSYLIDPAIPMALVGGAAMYTSPAQRALTSAISSRPELAQPIAEAIKRGALLGAPASAPLGYSLLNESQ